MKIYIIGPSGSGKTTLAKKLSKQYGIEHYELDKIKYDDLNGHIKRTDQEIEQILNKILKKKSWIIEDVGREIFIPGREACDKMHYIKLSKVKILIRVVKRWFKQRFGKEPYNYPPTLWQFYDMIRVAFIYIKKEPSKIKSLEKYKDKLVYIDKGKLLELNDKLI